MPSGEEVSYCAHAAMGAASVISTQKGGLDQVQFVTAEGVENTAFINGKDVELGMKNDLQEMNVDTEVMVALLDQIGLEMGDVDVDVDADADADVQANMPFLNSSVARFKTLVPMKSLDRLHGASNPKDADEFRILCDAVDSTGVYLYAPCSSSDDDSIENSYECRQFPRASGYPEDPATGIAAAALASSLHQKGRIKGHGGGGGGRNFVMYQGTAMGKNSRIRVRLEEEQVYCSGTIEIDSEEYISIDEL